MHAVGELKPVKIESVPASDKAAAAGDNTKKAVEGNRVANCGLPAPCAGDHIAVHLFSGKDNTAGPRMCIDGT